MEITCDKANPPLGGLMVAAQAERTENLQLKIIWGQETSIENFVCRTSNDLARAISKKFCPALYAETPLEMTTVEHWLTYALGCEVSKDSLNFLDSSLGSRTHLVEKKLTIADFIVFSALYQSNEWQDLLPSGDGIPGNVSRWYNYMGSLAAVKETLQLPEVKEALAEKRQRTMNLFTRPREGKFVQLPGAEMGKVVVRFPPEASGYLHIGHAKAALLNQFYKEKFQGKLIMRFDDTNPAKENVEFEKVILEDIDMLDIKPDMFTYTSQYFDLMLEYCEKLIKEGKAYVDDTEPERMKTEREQKTESRNRSNSVEKNLELWKEMKLGSEKGQTCCVRAKIDMKSLNGCMRDPTIYRCKNEPHPRTGSKYKVYPTYDFACPIVDSVEGVTHTLRTMEYHDRDPQFYWFLDALELRKPHIWEYSRLSMTNTVLSKRKLTWFVEQGLVDGWDDPRMPTVRGVLRRGMTVQGLKEFIIAQGSSRGVVFMEWDKIWAFNKKVIDPIAPRYTALEKSSTVRVQLEGVKQQRATVLKHLKNKELGKKDIWLGPNVRISREDAASLKTGHNATFIAWGNMMIEEIQKDADGQIVGVKARANLENKTFKDTLKLTWLAEAEAEPFTPTWCVYFDHIISKPLLGKDEDFKKYVGHRTRREVEMIGGPGLKKLKKGDIIQLLRLGYFIVDVPYEPLNLTTGKEQHLVLFSIPDGRSNKNNPLNLTADEHQRDRQLLAEQQDAAKLSENPPVTESELNCKILDQGDVVRQLKQDMAHKEKIACEVKYLLALKRDFKRMFGKDWAPAPRVESASAVVIEKVIKVDPDPLYKAINAQVDKIDQLKSTGMVREDLEEEMQRLTNLLLRHKRYTGLGYGGGRFLPGEVFVEIKPDLVHMKHMGLEENRALIGMLEERKKISSSDQKGKKDALKRFKELQDYYEALTNYKYTPDTEPVPAASVTVAYYTKDEKAERLRHKITEQGSIVRDMKDADLTHGGIDEAVRVLLELKEEHQKLTGTEFPPSRKPKSKKPQPPKGGADQPTAEPTGSKKVSRLGLEVTKEENFSAWYTQVITKSEMIEYYDVSGCYILRPWSYAVWEHIKEKLDAQVKSLGFVNCYFPMFVSKRALETEKTHISDFAPEVAWVTHSGDTEMAEPIAVRPTSETVMYPAYAKWIQSYRDLPLKLNQWNNVVRWEFKHAQPFLRTREFLWQEGHSAHANREDAIKEVEATLIKYYLVYIDLLAVPAIMGQKTEKEKFAGAEFTKTIEIFITASGRAIQGATSHHLGQNFSKMFDIVFEDPETQEKKYVFQNSFGITTRTIGVMTMVHGDNKGLVLPPKVAAIQAVIIPCGITAQSTGDLQDRIHRYASELVKAASQSGFRTHADLRMNYSPGWKFNHWEVKGVPVRIEVGPKDLRSSKVVFVRRDNGEKKIVDYKRAVTELDDILDDIGNKMYHRAKEDMLNHIVRVREWSEFTPALDGKNMILTPFCGTIECEDKIRADSAKESAESVEPGAPSMGAKSLCIPNANEFPRDVLLPGEKCVHPECNREAQYFTLFGRSY